MIMIQLTKPLVVCVICMSLLTFESFTLPSYSFWEELKKLFRRNDLNPDISYRYMS